MKTSLPAHCVHSPNTIRLCDTPAARREFTETVACAHTNAHHQILYGAFCAVYGHQADGIRSRQIYKGQPFELKRLGALARNSF